MEPVFFVPAFIPRTASIGRRVEYHDLDTPERREAMLPHLQQMQEVCEKLGEIADQVGHPIHVIVYPLGE